MLDTIILVFNILRYTKGYAINNNSFRTGKYIAAFILLCLSVLTFFLGKEYYFFIKEVKELKKLKTQYYEYVGTLKKNNSRESLFTRKKKGDKFQ